MSPAPDARTMSIPCHKTPGRGRTSGSSTPFSTSIPHSAARTTARALRSFSAIGSTSVSMPDVSSGARKITVVGLSGAPSTLGCVRVPPTCRLRGRETTATAPVHARPPPRAAALSLPTAIQADVRETGMPIATAAPGTRVRDLPPQAATRHSQSGTLWVRRTSAPSSLSGPLARQRRRRSFTPPHRLPGRQKCP